MKRIEDKTDTQILTGNMVSSTDFHK